RSRCGADVFHWRIEPPLPHARKPFTLAPPSADRRLVMSSPNQDDDADKPQPPPTPWASELQRRDEARRLQDEVIAAAQRLERQSLELRVEERAAFELPPPRPKFEIARLRPRETGLSVHESARGLWTPALDPVLMPSPPQEKIGLASPGMLVGLVGSVGVAAAIALLVAHTLQMEIK